MQTFVVNNPKADPQTDLDNAASAIRSAGWWASSSMNEHYPLSTEESAWLLNESGEYDVDASELADLVDRRIIKRPGIDENGELEWSAHDVITATMELEFRGQYKLGRNNCKRHPCELALAMCREAGEVASIVNGEFAPRFDVPHLVMMLVRCPTEEGRIKISCLLRATLETELGIFIR